MKRISLCFALLLSAAAFAADEPKSVPQIVNVGVYVLNVGKFDLSSGSYTMDFYLSLTSEREIGDACFEFMNGRSSSLDRLINEPTNKFYRIQANLYDNINLKSYPFDQHSLTIQLEDKTNAVTKVVYRFDPANSGIDPDVTIVGWEIPKNNSFTAQVVPHEYKVFGETYSKFVFGVNVKRITLTSILKAFLPAFFLVVVGLLALLLKPSTLLGAVMFHLNVTSQIPPVGYLTFADRFMIVSYIILGACLGSTILLMRHTDAKDEASANRFYRSSLVVIPPLSFTLYALAFLTR